MNCRPRLVGGTCACTIAALSASGQPAQMTLGRRRKSPGELDEEENDSAPLVSERVVIVAIVGGDAAGAGGGVPRVRASTRGDVQDLVEGRRQGVAKGKAMRVTTARDGSGETSGAKVIPRLQLHNEIKAARALAALPNVEAAALVDTDA